MANNKIQFKRTTISGRTPNTTNSGNTSYIDAGEFAVNLTDQKIYSSNGTVSFEVGANLASLRVGTIVANGATGTSGQALVSNGSAVFWSNNPGYTGSTGFTGSVGPQGTTGFTGSTGSIGYTGSKGTTTISNTAPTSPVNGDTWWNSETGVRYVYYADGTSNQWVQESAAGTTGFTGSAGTNGFTGSTGAGFTGSRGFTGSTGTGFTGSRGFTGSQGATGFTGSGGGGGVTTFDGGSTGLSPYSATSGAVSLGGTLNVGYGGTGTSSYPSNGQVLIGNSGGGYSVANLTAGSGVTITNGSGTITIAATGGGGGGPYIAFFQFEPSNGTYIGNGPTIPQQSPVVYWDSGLNQASLWWYYPTGGVSNNGVSIAGGITVQDNNGSYTYYTNGTDFSSSVSNWYGSGYVIGIYGLGVTNVTLRALMANTAAQLGSPAIAPRGTNMFGSQSTIYASVSGGINSSYSSGGRPIIVTPGFSNGYYSIYFNSGSPTSDSGLSLSYLTIDNNLGTGSYTYYAGTDFSVSTVGNDSNQQFSCQIYSVSNTTLSTLLNNTIIN